MGRLKFRRTASFNPIAYYAMHTYCEKEGVPIAQYLERLLREDLPAWAWDKGVEVARVKRLEALAKFDVSDD